MTDPRIGLPTNSTVLILLIGLVACSGEPQTNVGEAGGAVLAEISSEGAAAEREGGEHLEEGDEGEQGEGDEPAEPEEGEGGGEHDEGEEGGEHDEGGASESEESGEYVGRADTWDVVRRGARLVLAFDPSVGAFTGRVENTTESMLCAVRVEVHLSTGTELGPTERTNLPPRQSAEVRLPTGGEAFATWTAHPEMSACSRE